jgi:hypothetical protein
MGDPENDSLLFLSRRGGKVKPLKIAPLGIFDAISVFP